MFKGVFVKFTQRLAFSALVMGAYQAAACVSGDVAERTIERDYSGIVALPVARFLGLDSSCHGRRLDRLVMTASTAASN